MSNINKKSTPVQMREFIARMRKGYNPTNEAKESKKDLNIRDMLKITRNLQESKNLHEEEEQVNNRKTVFDQPNEEQKFLNNFRDIMVNVKFIDLEVYDKLVFWGGTVDGMIQFVYKVTPDESTSGVEFNYLDDFTPDNPENEEIIKRIEGYYDAFYRYWSDNLLQQ